MSTPDTTGKVLIGRGLTCDVRLTDTYVSLVHASITRRPDGSVWIEDEGSTNGTILNGAKVMGPRHISSPDDVIRLGHTEFTLRQLAAEWDMVPSAIESPATGGDIVPQQRPYGPPSPL